MGRRSSNSTICGPKRHWRIFVFVSAIIATNVFNNAAQGGIILDKPPNQLGGGASDTSFYNEFGEERWQRLADDVLLTQPATLRRVIWHGFYGDSFKNTPEPLPLTETMRIRLYDARPGDGLPGNVLFEESFLDPSRVA